MSHNKVHPSIEEATHYWVGDFYKVGEFACFQWDASTKGWKGTKHSVDFIKSHGIPLKTAQEGLQRTLGQPAIGVQGGDGIVGCKPVQEVSDPLKELVQLSQELGLYNIPKMTEKNDDNRSTTCANNRQVGGDHYKKMKIQPWDIVDSCFTSDQAIGFYVGNVLKYILRFESKAGIQDLEKAKHYLEKLIEVKRTVTKGEQPVKE